MAQGFSIRGQFTNVSFLTKGLHAFLVNLTLVFNSVFSRASLRDANGGFLFIVRGGVSTFILRLSSCTNARMRCLFVFVNRALVRSSLTGLLLNFLIGRSRRWIYYLLRKWSLRLIEIFSIRGLVASIVDNFCRVRRQITNVFR